MRRNPWVFSTASTERDSSGFDFKDVVCHDALGHTSFRRKDAFYGILLKTSTDGRSDNFAITIAQGQGLQGLQRADQQTSSVGITTFGMNTVQGAPKPAGGSRRPQALPRRQRTGILQPTPAAERYTQKCSPSGQGTESCLEASISSDELMSKRSYLVKQCFSGYDLALFIEQTCVFCSCHEHINSMFGSPVIAKFLLTMRRTT